MSMNLTCSCFDVRQTPTYITAMVLSYNPEGEIDGGASGAARRYILWCHYSRQLLFNKALSDPEKQQQIRTDWSAHIAAFEAAMQAAAARGEDVVFSQT